MLKTTMSSLIALGSARRETRAISDGTHMELIGGQFYTKAGVGSEVTRLGSAREETRAVEDGKRAELVPELRYATAEVRLS
ncbi:hypothetical protein [Brevundimonas sp.]|jgi:hypothetical protein|uniref:hypothetical protein n=1 Tax=unclassified Brevundimonas TaxID=2622653 RepID=UPI00271DBBC7|nr:MULTISPECIES: hypothetical protein [Brevundimonas]MDO9609350.1 hypothetical protein [Brevundimonas sp.]